MQLTIAIGKLVTRFVALMQRDLQLCSDFAFREILSREGFRLQRFESGTLLCQFLLELITAVRSRAASADAPAPVARRFFEFLTKLGAARRFLGERARILCALFLRFLQLRRSGCKLLPDGDQLLFPPVDIVEQGINPLMKFPRFLERFIECPLRLLLPIDRFAAFTPKPFQFLADSVLIVVDAFCAPSHCVHSTRLAPHPASPPPRKAGWHFLTRHCAAAQAPPRATPSPPSAGSPR